MSLEVEDQEDATDQGHVVRTIVVEARRMKTEVQDVDVLEVKSMISVVC